MGSFLTIGIMTRISIDKNRAKADSSATPEEIRDTLQNYYNTSGIYHIDEDEHSVFLTLKPEVMEQELIGFLQDFYDMRYLENYERNLFDMDAIKSLSTYDEWVELAAMKKYEAFQLDTYVSTIVPFPHGWRRYLTVNIEQIILSLDGKIIMECYNSVFAFFTRMVKEKMSNYKLAESLLVYISG